MKNRTKVKLKVTKKGTIIIPKVLVEEIGTKTGEFVTYQDGILKKRGLDRRGFLDLLLYGTAGVAIGHIADFMQIGAFFNDTHRKAEETDQLLLKQLFGTMGNGRIALVPARNHPFKPLSDNDPVYPIEAECCRSYLDRFTVSYEERHAKGLPNILPSDNIVLFGSQISNLISRKLLGNPYTEEPCSSVLIEESNSIKRQMPLRWNLKADANSPEKIRTQYGVNWRFHNHLLYDFHDRCYLELNDTENEDLLLVTSIPRPNNDNLRVLIFSGLHGAGTLASSKLLREPPLKELQRLSKLIGRHPHYQAIFKVTTEKKPDNGELEPRSLELLDAVPLSYASS